MTMSWISRVAFLLFPFIVIGHCATIVPRDANNTEASTEPAVYKPEDLNPVLDIDVNPTDDRMSYIKNIAKEYNLTFLGDTSFSDPNDSGKTMTNLQNFGIAIFNEHKIGSRLIA